MTQRALLGSTISEYHDHTIYTNTIMATTTSTTTRLILNTYYQIIPFQLQYIHTSQQA